ncbi:hypothetical protein Y032_0024g999 [Ancylostoma ceylanicum]|uniref:Nudix hydrolase domain-containing protein n=2 Tax=Ancylostoma ceylanicum TaxID=53326 RepID=A0A016UW75_9BILA|nr:hypothetical protein Y032_0024g999 [Ancylostoma ceylanicum]
MRVPLAIHVLPDMTTLALVSIAIGVLLAESECAERSPFTIVRQETAYHGKFSNLTVVHFIGQSGNPGMWEVMNTITSKNPERINGVYVIARLVHGGETYFVFNKQYRIPTKSWTLEFPGGIQEAGESPTDAGIRELKEETGFVATEVLLSSTGRQATMPSRLNDTARHVVAEIDGDSKLNSNPKQNLDDAEMTEVVLIKASELLPTIQSLEKELDIASNVYTFAIGYAMRNL